MADLIKFRRRRSGSSANPVPQAGEPIYDLGSKKLYVGDGSTSLNALKPIGEQTTVENANNAVNVTTSIGGKSLSSIFESNGTVVKNATNAANATTASNAVNVTTSINGKAITNIFESNGTTAKNATTASKIGSSTVGGIGTPVYINNGTPTACTMSSLSVGSATKATQDGNGSNIRGTYASTIDATYEDSTLTLELKNPNGNSISSKAVTISMSGTVDNANKLNNQNASYYRNASNIDAGTLSYSRLPSLYVGDKSVTNAPQNFRLVTYPSTGSSTIGGNTRPVYINNGVVTAGTLYAGGTNLTVNNTSYSGGSTSIYVPTNAISTSTDRLYLLGSPSTTSIASTNTNSGVYMKNGGLNAAAFNGVIITNATPSGGLQTSPELKVNCQGIAAVVYTTTNVPTPTDGTAVCANDDGQLRRATKVKCEDVWLWSAKSGTSGAYWRLYAKSVNGSMGLYLYDGRNSYRVVLTEVQD